MPEEQNKGQDFVSQRNLKNQLFGKKKEDVGALNKTMSSFTTRNIKALDNLTKQMSVLNKNLVNMVKPSQQRKDFVSQRNNKNEDLNKTMSSFTTRNIKALDNISKHLSELNNRLVNMVKPSQQKKDFVRREDPTTKIIKEIDDLEELSRKQLKLEKDKKKGKGLLGMLGMVGVGLSAAIAGSGLVGFLLTGRSEFLHSVVKGIKKAVWDIPRLMFSGFKGLKSLKGAKSLFKIVDVVKDIGKFGRLLSKTFSRFGFKGVGTLVGKKSGLFKIVDVVKDIGKFGKLLSSAFKSSGFKGASKLVGKKIGKVASKTALKKIPGVGTILGLVFGINRFRKGDIIGGIGEIVSGVASMFPGPGTAISLAVDALLLLRDFKSIGKKKEKKPKKGSKADLRNVPFIGSFIDFFEGVKMIFGGAPMEGIKMALLSLNTLQIPGVDWLISKTLFPLVDGADWLIKTVPSFIGKTAKAAVSMAPAAYKALKKVPVIGWYISGIEGIINFSKDPKKGVENIANFMNNMIPGSGDLVLKAGNAIFGAADWIKSKAGAIGGWVADKGKKVLDATSKAFGAMRESDKDVRADLRKSSVEKVKVKAPPDPGKMPAPPETVDYSGSLLDMLASGIRGYPSTIVKSDRDVNISGLDSSLKKKLFKLSRKFYKETGQKLIVTSGFRSNEKQAELYEAWLDGKTQYVVAPPGSSKHNYGEAVDISSSQANLAARKGWLDDFGLSQPLPRTDPVHIVEKGDGVSNLPRRFIGDRVDNKNEKIDLSDSTIQALANAMGASFKGAIPRQSESGALGTTAPMRG